MVHSHVWSRFSRSRQSGHCSDKHPCPERRWARDMGGQLSIAAGIELPVYALDLVRSLLLKGGAAGDLAGFRVKQPESRERYLVSRRWLFGKAVFHGPPEVLVEALDGKLALRCVRIEHVKRMVETLVDVYFGMDARLA